MSHRGLLFLVYALRPSAWAHESAQAEEAELEPMLGDILETDLPPKAEQLYNAALEARAWEETREQERLAAHAEKAEDDKQLQQDADAARQEEMGRKRVAEALRAAEIGHIPLMNDRQVYEEATDTKPANPQPKVDENVTNTEPAKPQPKVESVKKTGPAKLQPKVKGSAKVGTEPTKARAIANRTVAIPKAKAMQKGHKRKPNATRIAAAKAREMKRREVLRMSRSGGPGANISVNASHPPLRLRKPNETRIRLAKEREMRRRGITPHFGMTGFFLEGRPNATKNATRKLQLRAEREKKEKEEREERERRREAWQALRKPEDVARAATEQEFIAKKRLQEAADIAMANRAAAQDRSFRGSAQAMFGRLANATKGYLPQVFR